MDIKFGSKRTLTIYPNIIIGLGKKRFFSIGFENKRWRGTDTCRNQSYSYGMHRLVREDGILGKSVEYHICFPVTRQMMFCARVGKYEKE